MTMHQDARAGRTMMKFIANRKTTLWALAISLVFWMFDSVLHTFIYREVSFEVIPSDVDELWMRSLIIVLLVAFGLFADNRDAKLRAAEEAKREVFIATVSSTQHVLNNLLNQLQLVFLEWDKNHRLSEETRKLLERAIWEGKEQVERLSSVTELNQRSIRKAVEPPS